MLTLMTGTSIAQAIPIAISPILTRLYTPEEMGLLGIFLAVVAILRGGSRSGSQDQPLPAVWAGGSPMPGSGGTVSPVSGSHPARQVASGRTTAGVPLS